MSNTVSILSTLSTSLPFCESDSLFLHNLQRNLHRVLVLETNFKNTNVNSRKEVKRVWMGFSVKCYLAVFFNV